VTARARRSAPRLAPALTLVAPPSVATTSMSARRFDLERELVATPCGRIVEREQVLLPRSAVPVDATPEWLAWRAARPLRASRESTYKLWEPVIDGAQYSETREENGKTWGLAHTRLAATGLSYGEREVASAGEPLGAASDEGERMNPSEFATRQARRACADRLYQWCRAAMEDLRSQGRLWCAGRFQGYALLISAASRRCLNCAQLLAMAAVVEESRVIMFDCTKRLGCACGACVKESGSA